MLGRGAFRGVLCGRVHTTRTMATNARANPVLRPIHFEIETDCKTESIPRVSRPSKDKVSRRAESVWVSEFFQLLGGQTRPSETYLQQENVPYTSDGIVKGPEGHDVMFIEPRADGSSLAFFN
ncbi:hypothetical protein PsorP6_015874 [Peronosclerospora sorghi]|uniref:Uncharacterized protein n=1 Tax=Peronosclerospora sorghi TaxID=230839 RepID=A0ACC0WPI1_9STRA|nr:hypothetical protein PsorP6_015874 [Peronosclerospora sorghi]